MFSLLFLSLFLFCLFTFFTLKNYLKIGEASCFVVIHDGLTVSLEMTGRGDDFFLNVGDEMQVET